MKNIFFAFLFCLFLPLSSFGQQREEIFYPSIHSIQLYNKGDDATYPIIRLGSSDQLELHFDDFDADFKNLYFSFQLCNADWTPSNLFTFDYIKGFQSSRISTYRYSSIATAQYTHYQAFFPDRNSTPSRSGNYLLKVFENNDDKQILFTKRFLVVDNQLDVSAQLRASLSSRYFMQDQRIQVNINAEKAKINVQSPQDFKVVVMQNNNWTFARTNNRPTIYRGRYFEYSDDNLSIPAGREWRWLDLRTLRIKSDRIQSIVDTGQMVDVYLKSDKERVSQLHFPYQDLNGGYFVANDDGNNPQWQSDYSRVHFSFVPPGNLPIRGKDVYVFGELTNYKIDESAKMEYNKITGVYEKALLLKQGFYNYSYVSSDGTENQNPDLLYADTEGNFNATENVYRILVYYRPFGARSDELIGFSELNTLP